MQQEISSLSPQEDKGLKERLTDDWKARLERVLERNGIMAFAQI